jgi:hypothetical protein
MIRGCYFVVVHLSVTSNCVEKPYPTYFWSENTNWTNIQRKSEGALVLLMEHLLDRKSEECPFGLVSVPNPNYVQQQVYHT